MTMADRFQISKVNGIANVNAAFDGENASANSNSNSSAANAEHPSNGPAIIVGDSCHAHDNHLQPKAADGGENRRTSRLSFRGFGQFLRKSDAERKFSLAQLTKYVPPIYIPLGDS